MSKSRARKKKSSTRVNGFSKQISRPHIGANKRNGIRGKYKETNSKRNNLFEVCTGGYELKASS